MNAWRIHRYGGPDALVRDVVPRPEPGPDDVLVKVHAASVNPIDWKIREGKLAAVMPLELPKTLGRDCAGEIVQMGARVVDLAVGQRVLGVATPGRDGTHADFAVLAASQCARIPAGVSEEAAVCFGVAGLSAYIPLVEVAQVRTGERVLIHAGAGGVGGLAIQIAKLRGAEVVATCGPDNLDYVRSLGAAVVIDYTAEDFRTRAGACDVVFDTIGGEVHERSFDVLKSGGRLVYLAAAPVKPPPRADVTVTAARIVPTPARLSALLAWAAGRRVKPQVGQTFPLADAPLGYALSQAGHARGKIVLLG